MTVPTPPTGDARPARSDRRSNGQVVVIFAGAMLVMTLMLAVVIDISWLWSSALKIQRAADAAALAGAVTLPNDPNKGIQLALSEAKKNGYVPGGGVVVTPTWDGTINPNRMNVSITAPVGTFFMRVVGLDSFNLTRTARAEYNLPLKVGSPQNYFGVGRFNIPVLDHDKTGLQPTDHDEGGDWSDPDEAETNGGGRASADTSNDAQRWSRFDLEDRLPGDPSLVIEGIQVQLEDIALTGSGADSDCQVGVDLSWDDGSSWSSTQSQSITSTSDSDFLVGDNNSMAGWGPHPWDRNDFDDHEFDVRLRWVEGPACSPTLGVDLDWLNVNVFYRRSGHANPQPVSAPDGSALDPQNFWGAMQSYGAPSAAGDDRMAGYDTRKSSLNAEYDPEGFYNYVVEVPAGASGGEVWIFDPAFCDTGTSNGERLGTGEHWTVGGGGGASTVRHVNAYYELFDMKETPYDRSDDILLGTSGTTFTGLAMNQSDRFLGGRGDAAASCETYPYHAQSGAETRNSWWRVPALPLGPGLYRLHTTSRMPTDPTSDQADATGLNSFAIWARTATGSAPRVFGFGAMEASFLLRERDERDFFMALIEKQHAGKWMDIDLWDPGDTGDLPARLEILAPTSDGYHPADFYYNVVSGTSIPASFTCGPATSSQVNEIQTSTGSGTGIYNGKWLRLCVQIPGDYTAPRPSGEDSDVEGGWWKIRYVTDSSSGDASSQDLMTLTVTIRDNPVHLVVE